MLESNTTLDIIANNFSVFFYAIKEDTNLLHQRVDTYYCTIQYVETHQTYYLKSGEPNKLHQRYSVVVKDNVGEHLLISSLAASHCDWVDNSVYKYTDPHEINKHIMQYDSNSFDVIETVETLCYFTDEQHYS